MAKSALLLVGIGVAAVAALAFAGGSSKASPGVTVPASGPPTYSATKAMQLFGALPIRRQNGGLFMRGRFLVDPNANPNGGMVADPADIMQGDVVDLYATWYPQQVAAKRRVFIQHVNSPPDASGYVPISIALDAAPASDYYEVV